MIRNILLFLLLTIYIFAGTIDKAKKLFDNKQYKDALVIFNEHKDDAEAQYYLGKIYLFGHGVEKNTSKSFKYALKSAKQKFPLGLNLLGISYANGDGTEKNITKAIQYYRKAIDLNNTYAFINLAKIYQFGEGVKKDIPKAIYLYKKAIDNGSKQVYKNIADIYFSLRDYKKSLEYYLLIDKNNYKRDTFRSVPTIIGHIYMNDLGTKKDEMKALMYFNQAANLGDTLAMRQLGLLYVESDLIKQDHNKAIKWFKKAIVHGGYDAYIELGDVYQYDLKDYKSAIKYYQLAIEHLDIQSGKGNAHTMLALTYLKLNDYKNAYKHFLTAAKLGDYERTYNLMYIINKKPKLENKRAEALYWVNKSLNDKNIKKEGLHISQSLLYGYYLYESKEFDKAIKIASDSYKNGNLEMGCYLAGYYGSPIIAGQENKKANFPKSFNIAKEIIQNHPSDKNISYCYNNVLQDLLSYDKKYTVMMRSLIRPPKVTIINKTKADERNLALIYQVCDVGGGISNINLILNGNISNLKNRRGFTIISKIPKQDKCTLYKNIITLKPGKNIISIQSFDKNKIMGTKSNSIIIKTNYKLRKKQNLYFLSLAVSNYKDDALKLKYPVSDVLAIKKIIEEKSKNLFSNIYTYALLDTNATKIKLNKIFTTIEKKITINDVFIMYIAGHGVTSIKDGFFYFLPQDIIDTSAKGLIKHAISTNDIEDQLGKIIANKSLILIDTCDSGSFIKNISTRGYNEPHKSNHLIQFSYSKC